MFREGLNITLKKKIAIGYFLIFLVSALAIGFLYKGIQNIISLDKVNSAPNAKLHQINKVLTLVYKAENEARSFFISGNNSEFGKHAATLDEIEINIDSLELLCVSNQAQIKHLASLRELLAHKRLIVKRLSALNIKEQKNLLYSRALDEVYTRAYELKPTPEVVKKDIVVRHDSVIQLPAKKNFLQKFKGLFSSADQEPHASTVVSFEHQEQLDTIYKTGPSTDSIVKTLEHALGNLKHREEYLQDQSFQRENKLLQTDRQLLEQIREIVTTLEVEEVNTYSEVLSQSSGVLKKASSGAIILAIVSIAVMLFFLFLIFRDISLSRQHQQALLLAKQNAEDLAKAKEQFLANMSHEIRTPLSSIMGFTALLLKRPLEATQKQYVHIIEKASGHLLSLVNDILDLSKIEASKLSLEKVSFNLAALIEETGQSMIPKIEEKGLEFVLDIPSHANQNVIGDPFRLKQILLNLLSNAVKFTEKGKIGISVDLRLLHEKYRAEIIISDTGIGIPMEKQKEIFEEFSQADAGITRKYGGTGLGLSIARKLTEMHGGKITLESSQGKGSTFTVRVLFENPGVVSLTEKKDPRGDTLPENYLEDLKSRHILVIEDDETTSLLISLLFKNAGLQGDIAKTGLDALQMIEKEKYDVVFTDIQMPEMSGIELLTKIRENPSDRISSLPVVALTANVLARNGLLKQGFDAFLSKPFKESDFYQAIYAAIHKKRMELKELENAVIANQDKPYSFSEVQQFSGNDSDALRLIIQAFVENSGKTITELEKFYNQRDKDGVSSRAHRLLPSFRQFQIMDVVPDLETLERYKEWDVQEEEFFQAASQAIQNGRVILKTIASAENLS